MNSFRGIEVKGSCPLSVVAEVWVMVIPLAMQAAFNAQWLDHPT